ncbi:MAG: stage II sporulation protein M, partial [Gammaproteobacteria bacterium]|nr:stage II sporulation protein M [Gammaproteobacteria bacterium]
GFKLGWALLAPGRLPRGTALRQAAAVSVRLIGGVIMLLLLAAFIEAYWSSMTFATPTVKYAVGAGLWVLVLAYLLLSGRDQHAPD